MRDARALARFEVFFVSAVATVLVVRGALAATGYPQVGGGGLHVAHVLYGGLLMAAAVVVLEIWPGSRAKTRAAFVGGIGFGLFIDEVGKFLTKDVNYFFKPAVSIIYVVFVGFYLIVRDLVLQRPLTDQRRLALAATAAADLALGQLDASGRAAALQLLTGMADSALAGTLRELFTADHPPASRVEARVTHYRDAATGLAGRVVSTRAFSRWLGGLLVAQLLGMVAELGLVVGQPALGRGAGSSVTDITAALSIMLSAGFAIAGAVRLVRGSTDGALRLLYRSTLVTLLVTQIFVFARYQWSGLIGLVAEGSLLILLRLIAHAHPLADGHAP